MANHPANSTFPREESRFAVLLFTDIVGSTEINARYGVEAFGEALRTHNEHFERIASECHGIRILQHAGDGYFAEADSIAEAVKLALLFQDAMRDGPWGEVRLTTRVGIHAGEIKQLASAHGSGVVAPSANIASRVMNLAVGGQILLTRLPFDEAHHFLRKHPLVPNKTMPELRWLSHGPYLLKGCGEPIDIFEVGADGLAPLTAPPDGEKAKRAGRSSIGSESAGNAANGEIMVGAQTRVGEGSVVPLAISQQLGRDFLFGVFVLAVTLLLKLGFEQTGWGRVMQHWVSSQFQVALSPRDISSAKDILIVDISNIEKQPTSYPPFPGEANPPMATPRGKLEEIIGAVAELQPRSIAIDIDFSAYDDGRPVTPHDTEFFERVLEISQLYNVPIYLGVHRQRWKGANLWLGQRRFSKLAAGIDAPTAAESNYYIRWLRSVNSEDALPNVALALAGRAQEAGRDDQDAIWGWAARSTQMRSARPASAELRLR